MSDVSFNLIHIFNLKSAVVNSVFGADVFRFLEHFHWLTVALNTSCHVILASAQAPNMEIFDGHFIIELFNLLFESWSVNLLRCTFHKDVEALSECLLAGVADDEGENERASWIKVFGPPVLISWEEVDNRGSNGNANTHQQVTQNVQVSRIDIHVLFFLLLDSSFRFVSTLHHISSNFGITMAMAMSMTVSMTMAVSVAMSVAMTMAMTMTVTMTMIMVMGVAWSIVESVHHNNVEDEAEDGGDEHELAIDIVFHENSPERLINEPQSERKQENN